MSSNVSWCYDLHSAYEKKEHLTNKILFTQIVEKEHDARFVHLNPCKY